MVIKWLCTWVVVLCGGFLIWAQPLPSTAPSLLLSLQEQLKAGRVRALRDVASLLDRPDYAQEAARLLAEFTLFDPAEIDLRQSVTRSGFLDFYYENADRIRYSELLSAYYISPVESRQTAWEFFPVHRGRLSLVSESEISRLLLAKEYGVLSEKLTMEAMRLNESERIIDAKNRLVEAFKAEQHKNLEDLETICHLLTFFRSEKDLLTMLDWMEQGILSTHVALRHLSNLTNLNLVEDGAFEATAARYRAYLDSLGTIDKMVKAGYTGTFSFSPRYFTEEVDYFGRIISLTGNRSWIEHNAVIDLAKTKHPRSLFYLAALPFKHRFEDWKGTWNPEPIARLLRELTQADIVLTDGKSSEAFEASNISPVDLLVLWASRHCEFEWNESRQRYVHIAALSTDQAQYAHYFKLLTDADETVAVQAYEKLLEGNPTELKIMADEYRKMGMEINPALPSLRFSSLESLAELISFCKENGHPFKLTPSFKQKLLTLSNTHATGERTILEDEILRSLNPENLTGFEIWAGTQISNVKNSSSTDRILEQWYAQNLCTTIADRSTLLFFLKKAFLFEKTGTHSDITNYLNKLVDSGCPSLSNRLVELHSADDDIRSAIEMIRFQIEIKENYADVLKKLPRLSKAQLQLLPPPSASDLPVIFAQLSVEKEDTAQAVIRTFAARFLSPEMIPHLFSFLERGEETDWAMAQIERYFDWKIEGSKDARHRQWVGIWLKQHRNAQGVMLSFFEERLRRLEESDQPAIEEIAAITKSPVYSPLYLSHCLQAVQKLPHLKGLWKLNFPQKLKVDTDLKAFAGFEFDVEELLVLPGLFSNGGGADMLGFLVSKSGHLTNDLRAPFFNTILRQHWVQSLLVQYQIADAVLEQMCRELEKYLAENPELSEMEKELTLSNIAQVCAARQFVKAKVD